MEKLGSFFRQRAVPTNECVDVWSKKLAKGQFQPWSWDSVKFAMHGVARYHKARDFDEFHQSMVAYFGIHIVLNKCTTNVAELYLQKCRALHERITERVSLHVLIRMFTHMTSNVACEAAVVRPASLTPLFTDQFEQADNWHPVKYYPDGIPRKPTSKP